ncbi:TetR/AcrR family transcriptional regulator [Rhodococcus aerolatus]
MPTPLRQLLGQQLDAGILDHAAALFARRGVAKTSVQDVADAVGLSKAGLLHHFPSKDRLHQAVLDHARDLGRTVAATVAEEPAGPERDRRVLELVVDVALAHPGTVALLLSPETRAPDGPTPTAAEAGDALFDAFDVDPTEVTERSIRVAGALSALAVLTVAAHEHGEAALWRPHVVATCLDALGHHHATAPSTTVISTHPRPTHTRET